MSNVTTVHATIDSYTDSTRPNTNYGQSPTLKTATNYATYMNFPITPPPRAALLKAVLHFTAADGSWAGGKTITIKPVITKWSENGLNYNNRPTVDTPTRTGTFSPAQGAESTIDVTTLVAPYVGNPWYGLQITAGGLIASGENGHSAWRPWIELTWSPPPQPPGNLIPDNGGIVSDPSPILQWEWSQQKLDLAMVQVQIALTPDFASPTYDSGWVAQDYSRFNLTGKWTVNPNVLQYWRVRIQTAYSTTSPWSQYATWKYIALPTLTVTSPGTAVGDTDSPLVNWTFAGQANARVYTWKPNGDLADVSPSLGTVTKYEIPAGTKKKPVIRYTGRQYTIEVRAYDNYGNRVQTPGAPAHASVKLPYTWRDTGGSVPAPDSVAAQLVNTWQTRITWHRTLTPDYFLLIVNGEKYDMKDAGSLATGGGNYAWTRTDIPGLAKVAIKAGVVQPDLTINWSDPATLFNTQIAPVGAWLYCTDTAEQVQILAQDGDITWTIPDDRTVFSPIGRPDPVVIASVLFGITGSVQGRVTQQIDKRVIDNMVGYRGQNEIRLVTSDQNVSVVLGVPQYQPIVPYGNYLVTIPVTQVDGPWPDQQ